MYACEPRVNWCVCFCRGNVCVLKKAAAASQYKIVLRFFLIAFRFLPISAYFPDQSFAEKITGLLARPNQQDPIGPEQPWYLKYGSRLLGIVAAFCKS